MQTTNGYQAESTLDGVTQALTPVFAADKALPTETRIIGTVDNRVEFKQVVYEDHYGLLADGWHLIYSDWQRCHGYEPLHVAYLEREVVA